MARRLTRNRREAVCGGMATSFAVYCYVDPVPVRLGFLLERLNLSAFGVATPMRFRGQRA